MISPPFILQAALLIVVLLCLQLLRRAGSGREIVTISRQSQADVETSWANLRDAWDKTGLTFTPADIHDSEDEGTRSIHPRVPGQASPIVFKPLPGATPYSINFSVIHQSGLDYPEGEQHFEQWSVEPDGAGSKIVVQTRFVRTLGNTVRTLLALRKQAGILASPQASQIIASLATQTGPAEQRNTGAGAQTNRPRKLTAAQLPSHYGREAAISLLAFAYLLTQYRWQSAVMLAFVILWHEYGHLLAYRLTGRRGNRLMLVPFFGGIAVAGSPHKSEFEKAFCALMGPGFSTLLTLASFGLWYYDIAPDYDFWFRLCFYFSAVLNLLNLLPIYPLDGGQTAESFLRSFLPQSIFVHLSGLSAVGLVVLAGLGYYDMALFVGIFCFMNMRSLPPHSHLPAMNGSQAVAIAIFYAAIVAAHGSIFYYIST